MPKAKASVLSSKKSAASPVRGRAALHIVFAMVFVAGFIAFFEVTQDFVQQQLVYPTRPPKVVLKNRPPWMSDFLAEEIVKNARPIGLHSSFDHQLLVDMANLLKSNPWIRQVNQVRRVYDQKPGDTVEIDCDYRAPVALVKWREYYWLVDGDGFKLPEQYTNDQLPRIIFGADGKMNIRIIDGVAHAPVESGKSWPGDDLAAGLEMVKILAGQAYAEQIRRIDVSNFAGRHDIREAQLVLVTEFGTQIRWGCPPSAKDAFIEISAASKLAALDNIYKQKKRVDANQPWIDIRFDRITCPAPDSSTASSDAR